MAVTGGLSRDRDQEAGVAFVTFLRSSGLPQSLWEILLEKISNGSLGTDGQIEAVSPPSGSAKLRAAVDLQPTNSVYILPLQLAASRPDLERLIRQDSHIRSTCAEAAQLSAGAEANPDQVLSQIWRWAVPSMVAGSAARMSTVWTLEPKLGLWARHAENPNMAAAQLPMPVAAAIGGSPESAPYGAIMMWPLCAVKAGEELTRDCVPGPRSLQRAAAVLTLLSSPSRWAHQAELESLRGAVAQALEGQLPPGAALPAQPAAPPGDTRPPPRQVEDQHMRRVWSDYPLLSEHLALEGFEITEDHAAADIIISNTPIRDFRSLPSGVLVNQFPYEAAIIRKDLLPQTLRQYRAQSGEADESTVCTSGRSEDVVPSWYPPTYDLATEVQFFVKHFRQIADAGQDNHWVVKPAQGARSMDLCLTDSEAMLVRMRGAPGGDRVVQKYIPQPVLYKDRKFDLRVYLVVRSFAENDAYLYRSWYGRIANKAYSGDMSASQADWEQHFTVACYDDDPEVSSRQLMVPKESIMDSLQEQGYSVPELEQQLQTIGRSIVEAASMKIGSWPRSKALYGLDILLDATRGGTAQLLEVSFAPDFTSLLKFEPELVNDVVHACFSSEPPGEKFWRLGAPPAAAAQESIEQLPGYKELNEID
ncbi:hypothetical protein CVIRNUC_006083 [Coccomyxa viridis]|uniref:Tubulin-tyrosine ligase n=1 Tax=Coccomyxa viridis TaxID=1274662 RepID=A0AAV1I6T9_9CHLO|nr:hypothetical protein CVIRNUC_006083 [Coccomyxa viridis]